MLFFGTYDHLINAQGRVSLPAKFRQILEAHFSKNLEAIEAEMETLTMLGTGQRKEAEAGPDAEKKPTEGGGKDGKGLRVVLRGKGPRIELYAIDVFLKKLKMDMERLDPDHPAVDDFHLATLANVFDVEVDQQGRIPIPQKLRKLYGLEKDVVFVGLMDRICIFRPDVFEAEQRRTTEGLNKTGEQVSDMRKGGRKQDD